MLQAVDQDIQTEGRLSVATARALAELGPQPGLLPVAAGLRDDGFGALVTYSRKLFIPLTHLCRDVCHYCTFAKTPKRIEQAYLSEEQVLESARSAAAVGCKEALFTLGERPELRYRAARDALAEMGFDSTLAYVAHIAKRVFDETGILPHINAGCMSDDEMAMLRPVSASMGIMLESASERLCEKGMPHYGSPDKVPAERLATLRRAGEQGVPFTSGILIGIGETRLERIDSLLALRDSHDRYGQLQEVIIQNFRAKADTKMAQAPEPDLDELLWTIALARLIFGAEMSVQAPPNLSPGVLEQLVAAGINDWGGVSPVTPDFVNPEAPWPHLDQLAEATASAGKQLQERLTIYPPYIADAERWLAGARKMRLMVSGSAALPPPLLEEWRQATGQQLLERYGSTEGGMLLTNQLLEDGVQRLPGYVGYPFPGVDVRIEGDDDGDVSGAGELLVRGEGLFDRYFNNEEATCDAFTDDGWFKTGDTAIFDEQAGFKILGRTSVDMLKSGGEKMSALEIEERLLELPEIAECAVVGVDDAEWGQRVVAIVVAPDGGLVDPPAVIGKLKDVLPPFKVPKEVVTWPDSDGLPRNAMGKINKKDLVKRLEEMQ